MDRQKSQVLIEVIGNYAYFYYFVPAVYSNTWRLEHSELPEAIAFSSLPPLGAPMYNKKMIVVHPRTLKVLPVGVMGEILIGGVGTSVGYSTIL